jgi:predicted RND superfamily exporter protein
MGKSSSEQHDFVTALNERFAAIAGWSYDHRWIVIAACLVILGVSLSLATTARIDNSYEAYFDIEDTTYLAYEQYREDFGSDEVSYILYDAPDYEHGPWNLEVMQKIEHLTDALEDEVPFIYEVKSLVNAELVKGVKDGIEIQELGDTFPETQEELLALREQYLAKPMLVGGIVSADANHGALIIKMDRSSTDPLDEIRFDPEKGDALENLYPQVTDSAIEAILARPEYEGIAFYHSGDVPLNSVYNRVFAKESPILGAITSLVIGLLLLFFFRSFVGVLAPLAVVQISVMMCVALVALIGWKLDLAFGSIPTLLTAIGVAHSVHILSEFRSRFAELRDRREALVQTIYLVGTPCLMTSLTTAAGFASMSFVPIKTIAHMGIYGAFGVMAAFVMSLTLLMALLSFGRRAPKPKDAQEQRAYAKGGQRVKAALVKIAAFNVRYRRGILAVFALITVFSVLGITRLVVDSNWLDDFSEDMPIKGITERIDTVMGGVTNIIYLFDSGEADGIKDPAFLREVERVQSIADEHSWLVRKTYSIVDILKDLNQAFHGGDPDWYRLPGTRELVAQYLLLYEMSGGEETEEYVSSDYRRASLELRLKLAMTSETEKVVAMIDDALAAEPLQASTMSMTGIGALWLKLLDYIVSSQVQGFMLAFCVIAVIMVLTFRSLSIGLISMVPNLAPVVITLGVMGWLDIPLDYNKISIAAVAIGIAVDDTIHLMSRYWHEFKVHGDYAEALKASMQDVGRALLITSVALVSGFLVFTLSVMHSQAIYGILLATTIVIALVADFLLMPALVLTFKSFGQEREKAGHADLSEAD